MHACINVYGDATRHSVCVLGPRSVRLRVCYECAIGALLCDEVCGVTRERYCSRIT